MCGISGIISFETSKGNLIGWAAEMNRKIRHRGPDDEGLVIFDNANFYTAGTNDTVESAWNSSLSYLPEYHLNNLSSLDPRVVLGHRRLSIINLSSTGHQPMCDRNGRYWIVFNGEIYNFEELKKELLDLGHSFYSHTDTEVLLYSYIQWGSDCINKFIGMWAFVIYDKETQQLFTSRDRIGVKPFYYTLDNNYFSFASEIKALRTLPFISGQLNDEAVYDYLVLGKCETEEESIFKNIYELFPGHNLEININNRKVNKWKYYNPTFNDKWENFSKEKNSNYVSQLQDLLKDSIDLHLRADVTVGACLSGGLDSSIITALVSQKSKNLPVFTVTSLGDPEDESGWAKKVVDKFNLNWHTINPEPEDLLKNFDTLLYCQDLPCLSANSYTHFELMRLVNSSGVKVTIDGQGADELFAGYKQYYSAFLIDALIHGSLGSVYKAMKLPSNDFAQKMHALFIPVSIVTSMLTGRRLTSLMFRKRYSEFSFINLDFWRAYENRLNILHGKIKLGLNETLFKDFHGNALKTMLRVADRNSMHFSVESRVPFSDDYRIEEFAFCLPASYKVADNYGKYILRKAGEEWLPSEICLRKDKKGFSIAEKRWIKEIGEEVFEWLDSSLVPYLNIDLIKKDWFNVLNKSESTVRIWRILCFAAWMQSLKNSK